MVSDYGLFMKNSSLVNARSLHHFYDFPVDHIAVVSHDTFSTMKNKMHADKEYALTLDFSRSHVETLLAYAPEPSQRIIRSQVLGQTHFPTMVELPLPFRISVAARLGQLQRGDLEEFIPFVVEKVGPAL